MKCKTCSSSRTTFSRFRSDCLFIVVVWAIAAPLQIRGEIAVLPRDVVEVREVKPNRLQRSFDYELKRGLPLDFDYFVRATFPSEAADDIAEARRLTLDLLRVTEAGGELATAIAERLAGHAGESESGVVDAGGTEAGNGGAVVLTASKLAGVRRIETGRLESIGDDMVRRPVIYAAADDFDAEEQIPEYWYEDLRNRRGSIQDLLRAVGRIESRNLERDLGGCNQAAGWMHGTGFLVAPRIVMTNRHVVIGFADTKCRFRTCKADNREAVVTITFDATRSARVAPEFAIEKVLYMAPAGGPDVALLKIADSRAKLPDPVTLQVESFPETSPIVRHVVVCGTPYGKPEGAGRYLGAWGVKRVSPGVLVGVTRRAGRLLLVHDCSTTFGNSGSPVMDLSSGKVIGLHHTGRSSANEADPIWEILQIPEVQKILKPGEVADLTAPMTESLQHTEAPRPAILLSPAGAIAQDGPWERWGLNDEAAKTRLQRVARATVLVSSGSAAAQTHVSTGLLVSPRLVMTPKFFEGDAAPEGLVVTVTVAPVGDEQFERLYRATPAYVSKGSPGAGYVLLEMKGGGTTVRLPGQAIELAAADGGASFQPGDQVAVVGFNFWNAIYRPEVVASVFGFETGGKRCSPGEVVASDAAVLDYDCSTLDGSVGSPVVDLRTGRVVAIHSGGTYGRSNFGTLVEAVFKQDPQLGDLIAEDWGLEP